MPDSSPDLEPTDAPAESSSATEEGQQTLAEMLDAVANETGDVKGSEVGEDTEESPAPETEDATEVEEVEAEADAEEAEEARVEEEPEPPFHKHPRWQAIKGKLQEASAQVETLTTQVEQQRPVVESYRRLEKFCEENALENDDVDRLLAAGAAIRKGDSAKVLEIMQPYYRAALEASGQVLPEDLAGEVRDGAISEARAAELARERAKSTAAERALQSSGERAKAAAVAEVTKAVSAAEAKFLSDPDYAPIKADVAVYFKDWLSGEVRQGRMPSKDVVLSKLNDIVDERRSFAKKLAGRSKSEAKLPQKIPGRQTPPKKPMGDDLLSHLMAVADED